MVFYRVRDELESKYGIDSRIRFLGRVSNVQEYLQASDYFVSASLAEGLPNAVLEALACGLPCLLSDIAEHQEILQSAILRAMLFPVGESLSLAECLKGLEGCSYSQLSDAAAGVVRDGFSAERMSRQYQGIYVELLS
jgi:glycosyltransferase involved in cell wall biosynthesis